MCRIPRGDRSSLPIRVNSVAFQRPFESWQWHCIVVYMPPGKPKVKADRGSVDVLVVTNVIGRELVTTSRLPNWDAGGPATCRHTPVPQMCAIRHWPEVALGEVRHPEREEPYRTVGAVHPLRRALV